MKLLKYAIVALAMVLAVGAAAQNDTEFWFAAPENYHYEIGTSYNRDRPIFLHLTSFGNPSQVTINQPANATFLPISVNLTANATQSVNLTDLIETIENKPSNTILNFGLHLVATNPITAYYEQASPSNPDIFTLKGKNSLGTNFIIPSQFDWPNSGSWGNQQFNSFCIVATQNNTQVTITPKQSIVGHPAGTPFTITLNAGQVYSATAISASGAGHLGGSTVTSDKPIAISINDDSASPAGGAPDLLGDQIIPVSITGNEYVVVKGDLSFGTTKDRVHVFATADNTNVFRDGNPTPIATLNTAQSYTFQLENPSTYVTSNNQILIYHCSGYNNQPGAAIIPPMMCTGSNEIAFTRSSVTVNMGGQQQFQLMLITRDGNQGSFNLNGNTSLITAADFSDVPGTGGLWKAAKKVFSEAIIPVGSANILSNSSGLFHCGLVNGSSSNSCRYGFFSNFATVNLGPDQTICPGDSVLLDAGAGKDTYLWSPGGQTSHSIWIKDPGIYYVDVTDYLCAMSDTMELSHYTVAPINLGNDTSICAGTTITLDAGAGFIKYTWSHGAGEQIVTVSPGNYTVVGQNEGGCNSTDTIVIGEHPLPPVNPIKHN